MRNSQVHQDPTHGIELLTISSNIQEPMPTQPPLINVEEKESLVSPATHLMTFIIVIISIMMITGACYRVGHCSETPKHSFRIFVASLPPAIWIWSNQKSRKFAVRKVRIWLQFEQ